MVRVPHHDAARQNAYGAFEHANIYVHFKAVYTLSLKKGLGKGDDRRVVGFEKLFHSQGLKPYAGDLSRGMTRA